VPRDGGVGGTKRRPRIQRQAHVAGGGHLADSARASEYGLGRT
jgi:hypothetical protein